MAGASIFRGDESGAAAAAAEAAAAQAVSEAAASKAAHAKLQEDFEYRETSQIVSEKLASRVTDETKKAMVKDFFNGVLLDVRKNSADLSNLNTRVEEIATRVTTTELVLVNNKVVKIAMTRAIQKLVCTGFANWVLVDSWASLATKKIGYIIAFHIAAFVLVSLTSRADQLFWYRVGRKTRARESLQTLQVLSL